MKQKKSNGASKPLPAASRKQAQGSADRGLFKFLDGSTDPGGAEDNRLGDTDIPREADPDLLFSILMSTSEGIFGLDLDGICTFCNPSALKLLGFTDFSELVGRRIHDLIHWADAEGNPCGLADCRILRKIRENGTGHVEDEVFWRKDGTSFPVEYRSHPIVMKGNVIGGVVSFSDISERKAAANALRESEERFRGIFEQTAVGMATYGTDGRNIAANDAFCRMLGYEGHELVGLNCLDFTHPDDRKATEERLEQVDCGKAGHYQQEKRYVRRDGSVIWVSVTGSTIRDHNGDPVFDIRQIQDISDKRAAEVAARESEAQLRGAINNAAAAIVLRNLKGEYILTNRVFTEWHGILPEQALGKTASDLFPLTIGKTLEDYDKVVLKTGETCEFEQGVEFADGTEHRILFVTFPITLSDGTMLGIGTFGTDITERKSIEDALRAGEQRLRGAVDSLQEGFALFDSEDRVVITNEAYQRLNPAAREAVEKGWKFEDLLRANVKRGVLKESIGREEEFIKERVARHRKAEGTIVRGFAGDRHFLLKESRTFDGGTALTFVDITEQKKAEQSLQDTQSRLNTILSSAPIILWATDAEGIFTLFRGKGLATLGFDPDEAVGKPVSDVYRDIPEVAQISRRALDGETVDTVIKLLGRSYAVRDEPIHDAPGSISGTVGVAIDITDRERAEEALRESEEHLRAVIENSPAAISLRDVQGKYILVNREFSRWYGISQIQAQGKHPRELFLEEVWGPICSSDDTVISTRKPLSYEHSVIDQEGYLRAGLTNKFPIVGPRGNVLGIGSVCADITEYKQMEDRLRHSQKLEAIGQLTGGVAHDFNNILAVILTNLEFMEDLWAKDETDKEIISEAIQAVRRGANLTERLLSFSRKQQLRPEALDPVAIISDMVDLLRRALGESITIHTEFTGGLRHVMVDRGQFENALLNLAVNARDAMPEGGKLEIVVTNREVRRRKVGRINEILPGWYVGIEIRDNGEGMTKEVVERAFEPFFTTKKTGQGSGLGLSMVYGFVAQSGGSISVSSDVGKGTSVSLLLPSVVNDETTKKPDGNGSKSADDYECPVGTETILVVEDDPDVASSVCRTLTGLGYKVFTAQDANQALDLIRRQGKKIDLLFSDVIMPGGMNGKELAGKVREVKPGLRICLTSGYPAGTLKMDELNEAGITFLAKPYARRALAETIRSILEA